jgi:hypothetical protein
MNKKRNYKKEYEKYQGKPEQKKNRAARNGARRAAIKAGKVSKGDGKDIDHIKKLANGGSKKLSNTRVRSASSNRSDNLRRGGRKPSTVKKGRK